MFGFSKPTIFVRHNEEETKLVGMLGNGMVRRPNLTASSGSSIEQKLSVSGVDFRGGLDQLGYARR